MIDEVYNDGLSGSFALGNGKMAGGAREVALYTFVSLP